MFDGWRSWSLSCIFSIFKCMKKTLFPVIFFLSLSILLKYWDLLDHGHNRSIFLTKADVCKFLSPSQEVNSLSISQNLDKEREYTSTEMQNTFYDRMHAENSITGDRINSCREGDIFEVKKEEGIVSIEEKRRQSLGGFFPEKNFAYFDKRWYKTIFMEDNSHHIFSLFSYFGGVNRYFLQQLNELLTSIFSFVLTQLPYISGQVYDNFIYCDKLTKPLFTMASSFMSSIIPSSFLFVEATLEQCQIDCTRNATYRPTNQQTRPEALDLTLDYPYAQAPETNPYPEFCQLGCTYFYSTSPNNVTCKRRCDFTYRYNLSVGYSDWAEVARWECRDGCDIALARCQAGYYCINGTMTICPAGRWRNVTYSAVEECIDCERGRFRARKGGTSMDSCSKCPQGKYVNTTGTISDYKCNRCPDGKFGPEPGMALCKCITERSCEKEWESFKRKSIPFEGRW